MTYSQGTVKTKTTRSLSLSQGDEIRVGNRLVVYKSADAYMTTCRMRRKQNKKFRNALAREGYSFRKKSLWVSEAIHDFFSDAKWMHALSCLQDPEEKSEPEKINIDPALKPILEEGVNILNGINFKDASISEIIRHAIDMRVTRRGRYDGSIEEDDL